MGSSDGKRGEDQFTFGELIEREETAFEDGAPAEQRTIAGLAADEPWVAFTPSDRFGLAFSGGGIRSASFNLGVMQALATRRVLEEVNYLSTVSGGGYIGGFWTALRLRALQQTGDQAGEPDRRKQLALDLLGRGSDSARESEPKEIRHVRQFGQFLIPRVGFTRSETWTGILAVVMGMIPTLVITVAAIGVVAFAFVLLNGLLVDDSLEPHGLMLAHTSIALMWLVQLRAERLWLEGQRQRDDLTGYMGPIALLQLVPLFLCLLEFGFFAVPESSVLQRGLTLLLPQKAFAVNWELGWFAVVSASVGAVALAARILTSRQRLPVHDTLERVAARAIGTGLVWLVLAAAWEAARWALTFKFTLELGSAGLVSGGLFLWFRDWLSRKPDESRLGTFLDNLLSWLKPALPRVMAMIAATALVLGSIAGLQSALVTFPEGDAIPQLRATAAATVWVALPILFALLTLLASAVDTSELGLHGFYRSRIARAFLGARHAQRPFPLTAAQPGDDFALSDARELKAPVHLVCCAANHVQGDSLQTLGRGARSVVLSPHGVSLGAFAREPGALSFASALTASAAAFNSQMGSISLQFGLAVSFLMTAFNLRLGLWVHHPRGEAKGWFARLFEPGVRLFSEAAGRTRADLARVAEAAEPPPSLHLSDGGHFDNVGLYELVRRHCRYIIVSDATADPEVAFDDFGNAIRRVREDFGVEIEIDVAPLRPVGGLSRQHVTVGVIHYDRARNDTGTIVYLKPTFVGGEPPDVLQYRSRNAAFPHEGTADQFYDDVQWESYRRLGEHIASVAMPSDPSWKTKPNRADALFLLLRQRWHAFPEDHTQAFLTFTNQCSEMESQIRATAPDWFAAELFPELSVVLSARPKDPVGLKELTSVLGWVMQIAQLMEDVWVGSRLDDFASHPLNEGWMAYFHRWTRAPSFRTWWPLLRPIYSDGFRNFMKREFGLNLNDPEASGRMREGERPGASLGLITEAGDWPDAAAAAMELHAFKDGTVFYGLRLENPRGDGRFSFPPIPVASLAHVVEGDTAKWKCTDLKVPPWLVGGGIIARFLDRLISYFEVNDQVRFIEVDAGQEREEVIAFYKSRGFRWVGQSMQKLRRQVPSKETSDPQRASKRSM